jgi:hypothetical protein
LLDVCPTALALLEQGVPQDLDGRVITEAFEASWLSKHPVKSSSAVGVRRAGREFSEEEAAAVSSHLKDLGYIE